MTASNEATAEGALVGTLGRPADDKPKPEYDHWIGAERRHCKEVGGVRRYVTGFCCPAHTPRALQGLDEIPPGPGLPFHRQEQRS